MPYGIEVHCSHDIICRYWLNKAEFVNVINEAFYPCLIVEMFCFCVYDPYKKDTRDTSWQVCVQTKIPADILYMHFLGGLEFVVHTSCFMFSFALNMHWVIAWQLHTNCSKFSWFHQIRFLHSASAAFDNPLTVSLITHNLQPWCIFINLIRLHKYITN